MLRTSNPSGSRASATTSCRRHRHAGKTVIAALDYKRLCEAAGRNLKLLFVAHRQEILKQAMRTYRDVMQDGAFGELYVGEHKPRQWKHIFASVQSLSIPRH